MTDTAVELDLEARIVPGSSWIGVDAARGLSPVITVTVESVTPGKHLIDKSASARPPDDDVAFVFADGRRSVCGLFAFLRTYVPVGVVA